MVLPWITRLRAVRAQAQRATRAGASPTQTARQTNPRDYLRVAIRQHGVSQLNNWRKSRIVKDILNPTKTKPADAALTGVACTRVGVRA
jgi:hypothetical protein